MTRIIDRFEEIADQYDAAFVDLWGCMHNGVEAWPAAVAAMQAFRGKGGKVAFVTNSPRPRRAVAQQLAQFGVPEDSYDVIATSGDATRVAMFQGAVGRKLWYMGAGDDMTFFEPPRIVSDPVAIELVELDEADGIICLGPFDVLADPAVNRPDFLAAKTRGLKMLCANPDIVVDMGDRREWCAGALAQLYEEMGGEALYFGKPHPPIYDLARQRLAALVGLPDESRILCIGDGIATDVAGAAGEGLDCLFITGGLALKETGTDHHPDEAALADYLATHQQNPTYAMGFLR